MPTEDIKWIAFFSQTGAEIADIAEEIGRWPTRIITNKRPDNLRVIDPRIVKQKYGGKSGLDLDPKCFYSGR